MGLPLFVLIAASGISVAAIPPEGPASAPSPDATIIDGPPSDAPISLSVGAGVIVYPAFPGSAKYKALPIPAVQASYHDIVSISFPDILRVNAVKLADPKVKAVEFGPLLRYRFGRNIKDDRAYLQGLANRGDALEIGGYLAIAPTRTLRLQVDAAQATSTQLGFSATGSLAYSRPLARAIVSLGPTVTIVDNRYAAAYYGVSLAEASRSRFKAFAAKGGFERAGFNATVVVPVSRRWSIVTNADYGHLLGDAANSPIVRGPRGSVDQLTSLLTISYRLF
ncbi:MipA/OmpV family protein [Sphingomonas sp. GlSt437]|uniref:MipA/OmpV family protein n=1 Tax=Sphingomonas sp. GlSt437 TaxID=3389970 RepID=UPI003A846853